MSKFLKSATFVTALALMTAPAMAEKFGLGRAALPEEIAAWDQEIHPDAKDLPVGSGDAIVGEEIFADKCAACHGDFAEGIDNWPKLAGGADTLDHEDPLKTVGSYWPHLSTAYDYIKRSMPYGNAGTLSDDEVYAIVAYILYSNDLIEDDFVLSNETFLDVEMPNAEGFILDNRAETEYAIWAGEPCMENCKADVKVTMRAMVLDVTPNQDVTTTAPAEATPAVVETAEVVAEPAAPSFDMGDPDKGKRVFKKCASCHAVGEGAKNRIGPHLNGVFGRVAGSIEGAKYSKSMERTGDDGLTWTEETLDAFLENPKALVSKTRMSFRGLKKPKERADLLAYLRQFSDNPSNIPEAEPTATGTDHNVDPAILAIVGDPEYGEYLASECQTCHLSSGANDGIPGIVGWPTEDFVVAMHAYKEKLRPHPVMQMMAGRLSNDEIAALAAYFKDLE